MKEKIDDGEVELSVDSSANVYGSLSGDSFLDDFLRNSQTCTHTHTCNPPGPDAAHTHTCYHTHTHVFPSEEDNTPRNRTSPRSKPRRALGNREAVRKYREKKKAQVAYLEEEVKKLRIVNQQLIKKLQRQASLETEILRLRGLLLDLRGKIDNELGAFPLQKQCNNINTFKEGDCGIQSTGEDDLPCLAGSSIPANSIGGCGMATWETNCQPPTIDCQANAHDDCQANAHNVESAEKCFEGLMDTMLSSASRAE